MCIYINDYQRKANVYSFNIFVSSHNFCISYNLIWSWESFTYEYGLGNSPFWRY